MRRRPSETTIEADLAGLAGLSRQDLVERWQKRFGHGPPKACGRALLELAEAYALQAAVFGGLNPSLRRQLEDEGRLETFPSAGELRKTPRLAPGMRLVREWNGKTHHVDVIEKGFVWNGNRHKSLSAIAREITGARWSGPRFFGL